ncbi:hypothetical protein JVU11DRAFT_8157 [Chiua virens]|nr:hypothetical protein JVU11DRAFT_8157 [Chiua virens]
MAENEPNSDSPDIVSALLILATIFHVTALTSTSFRLWFRHHTRRLWWDDFWAVLALLGDVVCMVTMWTGVAPFDNPYITFEALSTLPQSRRAHIVSFWLSMLTYTCSIWFARISIVCSVVRIVPPSRCVSITAFGAGAIFVCLWGFMFTSKSAVCGVDTTWYHATPTACPIPYWVAISEVCTDAFSDIILVALPLRLLWRVKLPSNQKIMLLSVFSTSILVSVVSAVHTSYLIPNITFVGGLTAQIEGPVSLIVCNLLVIVTFVYRAVRNGRDLTAGLSEKKSCSRLTTVDLDISASSYFAGTRSGCTGTGFTGTNISSYGFIGDRNMTTGSVSVIPTGGGSMLPAVSENGDTNPPSIAASS